jgi:pimeloyl-ACP methyl ester carboxylesterase
VRSRTRETRSTTVPSSPPAPLSAPTLGPASRTPSAPSGTYADDLAAVIDALDLSGATLVGFSTGGGEVVRYIGRHGTERVAALALVSAVPPFMLRTDDNPGGVPIEVFDEIRDGSRRDRSQLYRDLADGPFFGNNRPAANVSQGTRDAFWRQGLQAGHRNALECIAAFSATDFRADLAQIDVPALVIHGDDDQVVPFSVGGQASAALIEGRGAQGLRRRSARHHRHAQGPAGRRPARLPELHHRKRGRQWPPTSPRLTRSS